MEIRVAEPADAERVAITHVRSWQVAYRGLVPDQFLDSMDPLERAERYDFEPVAAGGVRTLIAVEDSAVAGLATIGPARFEQAPPPVLPGAVWGELYALYLDPNQWGSGLGAALHQAAVEDMRISGFNRSVLWVLSGNDRARRFYTKQGWTEDGASAQFEILGVTIEEIRLGRTINPSSTL